MISLPQRPATTSDPGMPCPMRNGEAMEQGARKPARSESPEQGWWILPAVGLGVVLWYVAITILIGVLL